MNAYMFIVLFACASAASCAVVAQVESVDKVIEPHQDKIPVVGEEVPVETDKIPIVAEKVPVVGAKVPVVGAKVPVDKLKPISHDHVKEIVQAVHQHVPQVINHINKHKHQVPQVGDKLGPHVVEQVDKQKQVVADNDKVPHHPHVQQVAEQAHHHIPQVVDHHISEHNPQQHHVDHVDTVHGDKVPETVVHHATPHTVVRETLSTVATVHVHA